MVTGEVQQSKNKKASRGDEQDRAAREIVGYISAVNPIEEFFEQNWQRMIGCVVIIFLGIWVVYEYRSVREKTQGESAQRFSEIQNQLEILSKDGTKEGDAAAAAKATDVARENISALEKDGNVSLYGKSAPLYSAALLAREGKTKEALDSLPSGVTTQSDVLSDDAIIASLGKLERVRLLLSTGKPEDRTSARAICRELSEEDSLLSSEALLILARTSQTDSERKEFESIMKDVFAKKPLLRGPIENELKTLGYRVS